LVGKANPNYKDGSWIQDSKCGCGQSKDYRAKRCARCAHKSRPKDPDSHFVRIKKKDILDSVQEADSYADLAKRCNTSRQTVTRVLDEAKVDVSHFTRTKNRKVSDPNKWLVERESGGRQIMVRRVILQHGLLEYKCQKCKSDPEWMDKPLTLDLDHIDGNYLDNRIENLRFLCPNCHSQTPTYGSKNNAKGK
jgi:hypothetical protein